MRTGIFGGTFDPPHLGHLILAAEAFHQLQLDRLLWVLTPDPPHKPGQPITPLVVRLEMLQAALGDAPEYEISRLEIDRPGPQYAVDTVRTLRAQNPQDILSFLMGGDSLEKLPTWREPQAFLAQLDYLGIMRRPGEGFDLEGLEKELPGITTKLRFIDAPLLEIASSEIRRRARGGAPYRYYVHPAVYAMIERERVYR